MTYRLALGNSSSVNMYADDTVFYHGSKNMDTSFSRSLEESATLRAYGHKEKSLQHARTTTLLLLSSCVVCATNIW